MLSSSASQAVMMAVRLYLLAPFWIGRADGGVRLAARKTESLLAYLALSQPHAREKTAASYRVIPPTRKRANRVALASVLKQLGKELVLANQDSVQLRPRCSLRVGAAEFKDQATEFPTQDRPLFTQFASTESTILKSSWSSRVGLRILCSPRRL